MSTLTTKNPDQKIKEAISNTIAGIEDNADAAKATFEASSKLQQGFQAEIGARDFQFISDEPEELGGSNKGPNPVEYVLGALAACQEIVIKTHASQLGVDLDSVEVKVKGDIDLHGFFNLSDKRSGFTNVSYETTIKSDEKDAEKLQQLKNISFENCPVLDIVQNETPVEGTVQFVN